MGDIDRSQPVNGNYDHSTATVTQRPGNPPGLIDRVKQLIGLDQGQKEPVSAAPGYEGKTPAQIADEMSK